jgi:Protein of unknown function (DUF2917)
MFHRPAATPTSCLLPGQTRVIHASSGLHLQVIRGRLWVTQPHCEQDLFLYAGQTLALQQDWIVIQADMPSMHSACEYKLASQHTPANRFISKIWLRLNRFGLTTAASR